METIFDCTKNVLETIQQFETEDNETFEEYKSALNAILNAFDNKPPPEKTARTKKPKISIHNEVEVDSGMDATTATSSTESTQSSTRPSRSAKTKATGNLKLPKLGTKLRREIKLESISEDAPKLAPKPVTEAKENDLNSVNVKREKISDVARSQANSSGDTDSSVLVIANEVQIFTLSDDDNDENHDGDDEMPALMPPPLKPAPKKLAAKKTRNNSKNVQTVNGTGSNENTDEATSSSEKSLKLEKVSTGAKNSKANKIKTKKAKPILKPFVVKEEIENEVDSTDEATLDQNSRKNTQDRNENGISADVTIESVYEDANDKMIKPTQPTNMLVPSSTYVCHPAIAVDETFVSTISTFSVGSQSKTNHTAVKPVAATSHSSLLTEDDSDDEIPLPVQRKQQNNKELFNPCIQSPMQMKVAAFELLSPAPTRQTRTKTRQLAKENADNGASSKLPTSTTPIVVSKFNHTPLGKPLLPPKVHSQNILRTQSSVSQASSFNRPNSAQPLKNRSRDNSAEDLARGREAALEKKRKGEERLKRAQLLRETQEREKQEKYLKALQEKQEKEEARKIMKEQQEMQKQLKAQEQKRERELRLKAELAKAAKQDRENMLSKKIQAEKERLLLNLKQNKKDEIKSKYTFDMLLTDDSTDDEDKVNSNRPPPPAWSLRANRKDNMIAQGSINPDIIDKFFSCQPTTPDLAAIFPQIDSKYLKRNSSAVWNTPPRYSQLPKY